MKKKVGIITIYGYYENFGNRLQNYATQEILKKVGLDPSTIIYLSKTAGQKNIDYNMERLNCYKEFNEYIKFHEEKIYAGKEIRKDYGSEFDYIVIGSDQIWNYTFKNLFTPTVFADFVPKDKRITLSTSIGVSNPPEKETIEYQIFKDNLDKIKKLSVREDAAKEIIHEISGREDVEVLVDPTMMIEKEEWEKVMKRPKDLKTDRFILKSFLGDLDEEKNAYIEKYARDKELEIIDISDERSPYYGCGPSEFVYLEKNAKLVLTDSFHTAVFSIIFSTPFYVYERSDTKLASMNSRIETLLEKFNLNSRLFRGEFKENMSEEDNKKVQDILAKERNKAIEFLNMSFK